jgi:hypothetical protein
MNQLTLQKITRIAVCLVFAPFMTASQAEGGALTGLNTIESISANGGAETLVGGGVTCFKLTTPINDSHCKVGAYPGSWIAIPNNNKQLVNAAMLAKATSANVSVYYLWADSSAHDPNNPNVGAAHCPGVVFTRCRAVTIDIK